MIILGHERHLGWKALVIFILERTLPVILLVVIGFVAAANYSNLVQSASSTLYVVDPSSSLSVGEIASWVSRLILGLFIISVILFIFGFIIAWFKYTFYTYSFEEFDMKLKRGILFRKEITISYRQMQDINITRGILFQLLGVSRVHVESAGHVDAGEHSTSDIILSPLDIDEAKEVRDMLQHKIGIQLVKQA